ncbi:Csa-Guanyl Cyclase 2 [Sarcoptes scabiei]|nr:Csa-Guanyl Cyclase 2 [Sarcoptes scabiei]
MDHNADAEGNYTLLCLKIGEKSSEAQIVGSFDQTDQDLPILRLKKPLQWYGKGPIRSQPECGFHNELCENTEINLMIVCGISVFVILLITVVFFVFKYVQHIISTFNQIDFFE